MWSLLKAIVSGFVATKMMTEAMYNLAPMFALPRIDIAGAINTPGKKSTGDAADQHDHNRDKERKQPGMTIHYLLGTLIFPVAYSFVFRRFLPNNRAARGAMWGASLWAVGQNVVLPLLGKEPFFKKKPAARLTYFLVHMIYGIAFCSLTEAGYEKQKRSLV